MSPETSNHTQEIVVFALVGLALAYLVLKLLGRRRDCGEDCNCSSKIKRDPLIEKLVRKRK